MKGRFQSSHRGGLVYSPTLRDLPPPPPGRTGWPWTEGCEQLPDVMPDGSPWPRVSIVTPSFNQAQFVEETIRSVLLQGYSNLEYIIIDGGSTDGSVEIIRKYEPWLAVWVSEQDRGQSHAINKGWQRATGEIIAWLNSDDTYEPAGVHKVVEFLANHPDVDMAYGDCNEIDEQGEIIGLCPTRSFDVEPLVCTQWFIPQQSVFIRRHVIETVGYVREDLHLVMDWELWLRIALAGFRVDYVPHRLASFRIYAVAKTSKYFERSADEKLAVLDAVFGMPKISSQILALKRPAHSYVHRFLGIHYYWASDLKKAQRHLYQSIRLSPWQRLREKEVVKRFMLACLGEKGIHAARKLVQVVGGTPRRVYSDRHQAS